MTEKKHGGAREGAGRPTKYKPEYCSKIKDLMSSGMSKIEAAVQLGVYRDTLYDWTKNFPEFAQAMQEAEQLSQAWWERQARLNIGSKEFNHRLWEYNIRCRFRQDWTANEKHDVNVVVSSAEEIEKASARVKKLAKDRTA